MSSPPLFLDAYYSCEMAERFGTHSYLTKDHKRIEATVLCPVGADHGARWPDIQFVAQVYTNSWAPGSPGSSKLGRD